MRVLATHRLGKRYGKRVGIEEVDLRVGAGEIFGFLGPNGAGKTTTIRVLLGFLAASTGTAKIFDRDCWRESHRIKRDVGYVPGDVRLYPWLSLRSGLRIAGRARGIDLDARGMELADRFRIDPDVVVRRMSRGMRQKLALVLALAHPSRLLVLDEPTSGLDPLMQQDLAELLRERAAGGCTVFFSSHTLAEVEQLCDRVAIVRAGRIVADESLDALRQRALRRVVLFFDAPSIAASVKPPAFLMRVRREGHRWQAELRGDARELGLWIANRPVTDFTVGPPDLETIFHAYYRDERETD